MKHISDLFLHYKNTIHPPQSSVVKEFVVVCKEVTKIQIKPSECNYTVSTKTIYLQTHSLVKSELFQHKEKILTKLKKKLGKNAPQELV